MHESLKQDFSPANWFAIVMGMKSLIFRKSHSCAVWNSFFFYVSLGNFSFLQDCSNHHHPYEFFFEPSILFLSVVNNSFHYAT